MDAAARAHVVDDPRENQRIGDECRGHHGLHRPGRPETRTQARAHPHVHGKEHSGDGGRDHRDRGQQHQSLVDLGPPDIGDGGEHEHAEERDHRRRCDVKGARPVAEACRQPRRQHLICDREADEHHGGRQRDAEQAPGAVTVDPSQSGERRLQEKKQGPGGEQQRVQMKERRADERSGRQLKPIGRRETSECDEGARPRHPHVEPARSVTRRTHTRHGITHRNLLEPEPSCLTDA